MLPDISIYIVQYDGFENSYYKINQTSETNLTSFQWGLFCSIFSFLFSVLQLRNRSPLGSFLFYFFFADHYSPQKKEKRRTIKGYGSAAKCFEDHCLFFCPFVDHGIKSVRSFRASDYTLGIFKSFLLKLIIPTKCLRILIFSADFYLL